MSKYSDFQWQTKLNKLVTSLNLVGYGTLEEFLQQPKVLDANVLELPYMDFIDRLDECARFLLEDLESQDTMFVFKFYKKTIETIAHAFHLIVLQSKDPNAEYLEIIYHLKCCFDGCTSNSYMLIDHISSIEISLHGVLDLVWWDLFVIAQHMKRLKLDDEASKALNLWGVFVQKRLSLEDGENFLRETYKQITCLIDSFDYCDKNTIRSTIMGGLAKLFVVVDSFDNLPSPNCLIGDLVKWEVVRFEDVDDDAQTLYQLLSSCENIPKTSMIMISEEELKSYEELESESLNTNFCRQMQRIVIDFLLQYEDLSSLKKVQLLFRKGKVLRSMNDICSEQCVECYSKAIVYMEADAKLKAEQSLLLAWAYCYRAFFTQDKKPDDSKILKDIETALHVFSDIFTDESSAMEKDDASIKKTLQLLYNIVDFLALKGFLWQHGTIYTLIIRLLKGKNVKIEKCFDILWGSGRFGHAICASLVTEELIKILEDHFKENVNSIASRAYYLKEAKSISIFSLAELDGDTTSSESYSLPKITISEIKDAITKLTACGTTPRDLVHGGYLCYQLSEVLMLSGQLSEALLYAKKAFKFREQLRKNQFCHSDKILEDGQYHVSHFQVTRSIASDVISSFDELYLSPWSILQCHLDSVLQVGILYELIGHSYEALTLFEWGKQVSKLQGLTLFAISFCSAIGTLRRKQQKFEVAKNEFKNAEDKLKKVEEILSGRSLKLRKCTLILGATIDQQLGDLFRSQFKIESQDSLRKNSESHYKSALEKLERRIWKISKVAQDSFSKYNKEFIQSGELKNILDVKMEFVRKRILLRVLVGKAKCVRINEVHDTHLSLKEIITALVHRKSTSPLSWKVGLDLLRKESEGDVFVVERAVTLYNISWFSLNKKNISKRDKCCDFPRFSLQEILSMLKLAFVLCREVPTLFQKVSRLLATLCTYSGLTKSVSSTPSLTESHWASFFHQASLGTQFNSCMLSNLLPIQESEDIKKDKRSDAIDSSSVRKETSDLLRLAPNSVKHLDEYVKKFFEVLPFATVICMSIIEDDHVSLLRGLLSTIPRCVALSLLSRFNSGGQPIVVLLPVKQMFLGQFRKIQKGIEDMNPKNFPEMPHDIWLEKMKELDNSLHDYLWKLEDVWFSSWKNMLLGECTNREDLESQLEEIATDLKYKLDISDNLLRMNIVGLKHGCKHVVCSESKKGCYLTSNGHSTNSTMASQMIQKVATKINLGDNAKLSPTFLVLDIELQSLPLESIPILRNHEVYRMPSVTSIIATIERHNQHQGRDVFPLIDPNDAFFMLHNDKEEKALDVETVRSLAKKKIKTRVKNGKAGGKKFIQALIKHDLFLYFGHGTGTSYMYNILEYLEKCSAVIMMACKSALLSSKGCYLPKGLPLLFLLAGSPMFIGTLWSVPGNITFKFGKTIVDDWLIQKSYIPELCNKCALASELEITDVMGEGDDEMIVASKHRWFMIQARQTCELPYLVGGSVACYGVPIRIRRICERCKDDVIL